MNTNSNKYTVLYATIMVVIVAALLSFTALQLKPLQQKNREIEKKQYILKSVNIASTTENAEELYKKFIVNAYAVNSEGEIVVKDAKLVFKIDLKKEQAKKRELQKLPVFVFEKEGQGKKLILPVRGKGMWGPIWGFLAMNQDGRTIYGAIFDHASETPGLGAEIGTAVFQKQFAGKTIIDTEGKFTSVKMVKGTAEGNLDQFDAVSGGTVTSKGLNAMLHDNLDMYKMHLKSSK